MREHKFSCGYKDTLNPLFSCSIEAELKTQYFRYYYFYNENQAFVMNNLENIPISLSSVSHNNLISLFLYGDDKFYGRKNKKILMSTERLIKDSQKFHE